MSNSSSNCIYLQKPSGNVSCNSNGSNLGVSDPLDVAKLSARPNRTKIRSQLKDFVLLMLGAPVVTVELDEQQLDAAVDVTLQILEEWAP